MKKIIGILTLLCLLLGMLTFICACGGDDDTTPVTTTPTTAPSSSMGTSSTQDSTTADSSGEEDNKPDEPTTAQYTINALDAFGNNLTETVVVEIFKENGSSLGIMMMKNGTITRELEKGNYTFSIEPVDMDSQFYYDSTVCCLSEESTTASVTVYNYADENNRQEIWAYDESVMDHVSHNAVQVSEGGTYVKIENPSMTYFIFTPTRGGIYRFSYVSNKSLTIGYYGSPHNVLTESASDVVDGAFEVEVKNDGVQIGNPGGTTQLVIGIRSYVVKNCVLKIERVGDATVELPWTDVPVDKDAVSADNYLNSEFTDFDVTDKNLTVVFNENDGYYHLNTVDGPLVYVRISTAVIKETTADGEVVYSYLPSFITMCETDRLGKVFFDESGNVVLKESYNEMFKSYSELSGSLGMYPLNEQLARAIKNIGEHKGWFELTKDYHIFGDNAAQVVKENAWLFACCYETPFAKGTEESPAFVEVSAQNDVKTYALNLKNGENTVLRTVGNATLTISNGEGIKIVANNGVEYLPDTDGKISVNITANQNFTIVYEGSEDVCAVYFTFVEYFN